MINTLYLSIGGIRYKNSNTYIYTIHKIIQHYIKYIYAYCYKFLYDNTTGIHFK